MTPAVSRRLGSDGKVRRSEAGLDAHAFRCHVEILRELLEDDRAAVGDAWSAGNPAPGESLEFMGRHGLRGDFARRLRDPALRARFVGPDLDELDRALRVARVRQAGLVAELLRLVQQLERRGIEFRLLKGPGLATRFFGGIDERDYTDLDLLVRRDQLAEADRFLREEGYQKVSGSLLGDRIATQFAHGYDYTRGPFRVDLHWALVTHFSYRIDEARLWGEQSTVVIAGRELPVFSDASVVLGHVVSFFEDLERGVGRLKTVVDLHAILHAVDGTLDWEAFFERCRAERVEAICREVLGLSIDLLGARERFAGLAAALDGGSEERPPLDWERATALLEARPGSLGNKLWASHFYACPRALALAGWLVSLPFRVAVYDPAALSRRFGFRTPGS